VSWIILGAIGLVYGGIVFAFAMGVLRESRWKRDRRRQAEEKCQWVNEQIRELRNRRES